jgi:hypothetical protein
MPLLKTRNAGLKRKMNLMRNYYSKKISDIYCLPKRSNRQFAIPECFDRNTVSCSAGD